MCSYSFFFYIVKNAWRRGEQKEIEDWRMSYYGGSETTVVSILPLLRNESL